jgi:hypothetical protein
LSRRCRAGITLGMWRRNGRLAELGIGSLVHGGLGAKSAGLGIALENEALLSNFAGRCSSSRRTRWAQLQCARYRVDDRLGGPGIAGPGTAGPAGGSNCSGFVPNHVAQDHPWLPSTGLFHQGETETSTRGQESFRPRRIFACGRDHISRLAGWARSMPFIPVSARQPGDPAGDRRPVRRGPL